MKIDICEANHDHDDDNNNNSDNTWDVHLDR